MRKLDAGSRSTPALEKWEVIPVSFHFITMKKAPRDNTSVGTYICP